MEPNEVRYCLDHYRESVARSAFLKTEIENLEKRIRQMRDTMVENSISITQKWTGMPHGSEVGDPTGGLAQRIADGDTPEYMREMEAEMRKKQEEYSRRTTMMAYVESWLHVLNERERYVVKTQWLGGSTWRELISGFQEQFGDEYSLQGLRKIRDRAFKKICEIAK